MALAFNQRPTATPRPMPTAGPPPVVSRQSGRITGPGAAVLDRDDAPGVTHHVVQALLGACYVELSLSSPVEGVSVAFDGSSATIAGLPPEFDSYLFLLAATNFLLAATNDAGSLGLTSLKVDQRRARGWCKHRGAMATLCAGLTHAVTPLRTPPARWTTVSRPSRLLDHQVAPAAYRSVVNRQRLGRIGIHHVVGLLGLDMAIQTGVAIDSEWRLAEPVSKDSGDNFVLCDGRIIRVQIEVHQQLVEGKEPQRDTVGLHLPALRR